MSHEVTRGTVTTRRAVTVTTVADGYLLELRENGQPTSVRTFARFEDAVSAGIAFAQEGTR